MLTNTREQPSGPPVCLDTHEVARSRPGLLVGNVPVTPTSPAGVTTARVWVLAWVSTPMTKSKLSATIAMRHRPPSSRFGVVTASAREEAVVGRNCKGSPPGGYRAGHASDQATATRPGPAPVPTTSTCGHIPTKDTSCPRVRCFYVLSSHGGGGVQGSVELSGDIAFEAADDLASGVSLGGPPLDVLASGLVVDGADEHDGVQGTVQAPVSSSVEAVAHRVARGSGDRAGTGQGRERGFGVDATGVGEGQQRDGRGDGSHPRQFQDAGGHLGHDCLTGGLVPGQFQVQGQHPFSQPGRLGAGGGSGQVLVAYTPRSHRGQRAAGEVAAGVDAQVSDPQQGQQGVLGAGGLTVHLLAGHHQHCLLYTSP